MTNSAPASTEEPFHFAVSCPVEKPLLRILRRFVTNVAEEMGFCVDDVMKIEISVDEACSNIARHAYGEEPRARAGQGIELKLKLEPDALIIHVQDHGKGGRPEQMRGAASLEDYRQPGRDTYDGLGLLIIRQFMDDVRVDARPETGTIVIMRKALRTANAGSPPHDDPRQYTEVAG